jgi:hypothetical protein
LELKNEKDYFLATEEISLDFRGSQQNSIYSKKSLEERNRQPLPILNRSLLKQQSSVSDMVSGSLSDE